MLFGVGKYRVIFEKGLDLLDNDGGKVVIFFVDAKDSSHDVADLLKCVSGGELLGLEQIIFGDVEVVLGAVLGGVVITIVFVVGKGLLRKGAGGEAQTVSCASSLKKLMMRRGMTDFETRGNEERKRGQERGEKAEGDY